MTRPQGYRDYHTMTRWVSYLLYLYLLATLLVLISSVLDYRLLTDLQHGVYLAAESVDSDVQSSQLRLIGALLFSLATAVVAGTGVLLWTYRAVYNAHQLGSKGMQFSPGWAVASYFIPGLNLWKPFQVMKELWQTSLSTASGWSRIRVPGLMRLWWGLWLVVLSLGRVTELLTNRVEQLLALRELAVLYGINALLSLPLTLLLLYLIRTIQRRQQAQHQAQQQTKPDDSSASTLSRATPPELAAQ